MSNSPSKISKRNDTAILTAGFRNNHYIQYEIKPNFNINELNKLDNDYLPSEIKSLILESYKLVQVKTIEDLILL